MSRPKWQLPAMGPHSGCNRSYHRRTARIVRAAVCAVQELALEL